MSYCPYCSKELADGEVCNCRAPKENEVTPIAPEPTIPAEPEVTAEAQTAPEVQEPAAPEDAHADVQIGANLKAAFAPFTEKCKAFFQNPKKRMGFLIGAAAALVLLITLIIVCSVAGNNYMKPINTLVKELNKGTKADYETLETVFSTKEYKTLFRQQLNMMGEDALEEEQEDLEEDFEDLTDEIPGFSVSFEIKKTEKMEKSDLKDLQETLRESIEDEDIDKIDEVEYDDYALFFGDVIPESQFKKYMKAVKSYTKSIQSAKVSGGYEVRGRFIVKDGKETVAKTEYVTLNIIKLNGDWVVYSHKDGDSFSWDDKNKDYDYYAYSFLMSYFYQTARISSLF